MTSDDILMHLKRKKYSIEIESAATDFSWRIVATRNGFDIIARAPSLREACNIVLEHTRRDDDA